MFQAVSHIDSTQKQAHLGTVVTKDVTKNSVSVVDAYLSKTYDSTDSLSGRERQVLQLVGEGKSTKDVAVQLGMSVKTAESHRARLMKKLDIHETASLVRYAIRRGLIQA